MYLRADHAESDLPTLRSLIHTNPLGILTTAIPSPSHPLLQSTHIPWLLDVQDPTSPTEHGVLRGHIARANPQAKALIEAATRNSASGSGSAVLDDDVMVLFSLPAHHYVSPHFYTTTKPATAKVVPTWNYAAVQVYGKVRVYFGGDEADAFLESQVADLSVAAEAALGFEKPWVVSDAPEGYLRVMRRAIVGLEIVVGSMVGKWKMSQEMRGDREGIVAGFEGLGTDVGREIAGLVRERGELADRKKGAI